MKKLIQSKMFIFGFVLGVLALTAINYQSYLSNRGSILGKPYSFGYPFDLYVEKGYSYELYLKNGFTNSSEILYLGLIVDIFFALFCSFFVGLAFKFVWSKISARKLR